MFSKKTQKETSESSKHWYQDKYQHVLTQRNVLALIAILSLLTSIVAVFGILRLAPLKSVEPYLLQIDEKTGITQKISPYTRDDYAANDSIDRYFTSQYIRTRESYNPSIVLYNYNVVRLMSTRNVFEMYRRVIDASAEGSLAKKLGAVGRRDIKILSVIYITNPVARGKKPEASNKKIMQARITTVDSMPNADDISQNWLITIEFEYANINLNEQEQLINPLGYQVTTYQIQREVN